MSQFGILPLLVPTFEVAPGDLSVVVYGRAGVLIPFAGAHTGMMVAVEEPLHITDTVQAVLSFLPVQLSEALHITDVVQVDRIDLNPTLTASLTETLHVSAGTVTRTWNGSGMTTFMASAGHATVIDYTARLRVYGNSTVIASENLFKPTPDGNNLITVDLSALFAYRAPGDYTVSILARDAGGSTDSEESSPFTLPLPWWPVERLAISETITVVRV